MTHNDAGPKLSHPQTGVFIVYEGIRKQVLRINWHVANVYQTYRPLKVMIQEIFFTGRTWKEPIETFGKD